MILLAVSKDAAILVFITLEDVPVVSVLFMDSALGSFLCWFSRLIAGPCVLCARSYVAFRVVGV